MNNSTNNTAYLLDLFFQSVIGHVGDALKKIENDSQTYRHLLQLTMQEKPAPAPSPGVRNHRARARLVRIHPAYGVHLPESAPHLRA
jgi:hypothetical protein